MIRIVLATDLQSAAQKLIEDMIQKAQQGFEVVMTTGEAKETWKKA